LDLNFGHPTQPVFGVRLYSDKQHWTEIGFDTSKNQFYIDRTLSGEVFDKGFPARTVAPIVSSRPYDLKLIVDRSSVEAFTQDGTIAMTDLIYSSPPGDSIQIVPVGVDARLLSGQGWELSSIWKK
jgi:fructan beta-fructosidase